MDDMFQAKKREVASGDVKGEMDLMGALVKGAGIAQEALSASSSLEEGRASSQKVLTDQEILGNAFVFILAGHETAANSIHFSLLFLAMRTSSQRHLQEDLTEIFGDRPIPEWDYERDLPRLFGGMAGAVLAEELRLVPPVTNIPKTTPRDQIQPLVLDNKTYNVPAGTMVNLCTSAVHRNPKFWPVAPPSDPKDPHHPTSNLDNNLEEFLPERWLLADDKPRPGAHKPANSSARTMPSDAGTKSADTDDLGVNTAADTAATLLKPPRGAYIPFSEGYRACLGRRFAQVEILAVLAVIFNHYSVELAVDDWATDEEVEKMDMQARRVVWEKARQRARWLMREGMGVIITMQMRKGVVPLRIVRRGEERFRF
jgi:cytochrome P450